LNNLSNSLTINELEKPVLQNLYFIYSRSFFKGTLMKRLSCLVLTLLTATLLYSNTDPIRLIHSIGAGFRSVELDDSAVWLIKESQSNKIRYWQVNDPVVLYPSHNTLFNNYRFYLYNQRVHESAYAELSLGPIINGPCTNRVIYKSAHRGRASLRDGRGYETHWTMAIEDYSKLSGWCLNDSVIIGNNHKNTYPWTSNAPYILFNVEQNEYIKAYLLGN